MAIPYHVRKKIADFDPVRDGKTIKAFCKEHEISRQTFFNIKKRVDTRGTGGITPDSTAPKSHKQAYSEDLRKAVFDARATLKDNGCDYGPWSIYYHLIDVLGIDTPPSRSTIARWLKEAGLAEANARKRPRSSYRRFARSQVNELWQIDGLVYRLFDSSHTQVTIYQVIDDASRFDVGSKAFPNPENGEDARTTLAAAFAAYGRPQEMLSDNGEAFASYRRGWLSKTELWLGEHGVRSTAGDNATTQGKDERSHQTLTKYLDARSPTTLDQVQQILESYRDFYNTRRRHQSLLVGKMHITPEQAWQSFPHAPSPTEPIAPGKLLEKLNHQRRKPQAPNTDQAWQPGTHAAPADSPATPGTGSNNGDRIEEDPEPTLPAITPPDIDSVSNHWGIPSKLQISKNGAVRVTGHSLYVGIRFKNRTLYSYVTDERAEFYTAHDGELLFSVPLPIKLSQKTAGSQVNINHVIGMWHRQPPKLNLKASKPRPSRRKHPQP